MKPVRVLHFRREVPTGGGPETLIIHISRFIDRDRFPLTVATLGPDENHTSPFIEAVRDNGIPVVVIPAKHRFDHTCIGSLGAVIRNNGIDVLHTHDHRTNLIGYRAAKRLGTRTVATIHQPMRRHWWLKHFEILDERIVRRLDRLLPVAEAVKRDIVERRVAPANMVTTVLNGIDVATFDTPGNGERIRKELGIPPEAILGITMGRLSDDKGLPSLLRALHDVTRRRDDIYWLIAGKGPLDQELRRSATQLGLNERVRFLGFRTDLPDLFAASDMLVIASTSEGCSVVALESMASGLPLVATAVGGTPEIVVHGETGFIIQPRRPEQIVESVLTLASDVERRESMGRRAAERVREHFTAQRMVQDFENVYADVTSL